MKTQKLLVFVLVMQSLVLAGQWLGVPQVIGRADAQIPDAGGQRLQMIDELRDINGKLDRLLGLLEGGQLQVKVATPDEMNSKSAN